MILKKKKGKQNIRNSEEESGCDTLTQSHIRKTRCYIQEI